MENVYKTPEAPLVETRGAKRAHFFVTSLGKMSVLFLVTLGLYGVYWMYKHWKAQQPQMERRISPVWRAIFGIFFFHALARRIHRALPEERQALWSPSEDATWAVVLTVAANLISHLTDVVPALEPYSLPSLLLLLTPLIPMRNIQRQANLASGDPQGTGNSGYSGYNLLFIVLGALYWLLILIGSAVILFGPSLD
ncbi:DUF4234 domain-containing protein [Pseudomonas aeruginosa]|uniref:DUF4234 domain-containing protein n=1 Tax=Pseudomonas aeruginosa TaxID=287 RepID=UPI000F88C978|nr:DUF4234 domain-containing protein [Pseudomonas aeruginosa]EKV4569429.1 DUF4234 domain-containing protein [Pseudomonas aeruginosa]EKV4571603.1 DUF4234 domain-containing protein [Pseudomonas aeruginosa]MCV4357666.1 DUF4234 domain-containing protein [Pseudomonas aeruginosa]MCW3884607.1 DUF4234 domain-containing protein [Pseudomonas aeruginosa]RUB05193.1 hypothetical protein IPC1439_05970 [Pseudomonas aeruginosa]